ncbi:MAG TPA: ribulokinase [Candidatus Limnocylindrales bacterium]
MPEPRYTIGVDFGTESARAVLVDVADGRELGVEVYQYRNGVIDERLPAPDQDVILEPDWALQDPNDYIETFKRTIPGVIVQTGIDPAHVIGIGIDFTACTMLPTTADGTPLCMLDTFRSDPHAWVKLWKHHAAQPEADDINRLAAEMGEVWPARYGGKISSEWFFPKALQILREAPGIYAAADRLIEAADWVVWQLTGVETRNNCTAGYKAIWSAEEGFPRREFFAALDPAFADVVDTKMSRSIQLLGQVAGRLCDRAAEWTGLPLGIAVAVANVDAHVSAPAVTVTEPGTLVAIMGTSTCHVVLADDAPVIPGACGVVRDGIVPGFFGYEAGQSAVGDIFAWFVDHCVSPEYFDRARERKLTVHQVLEEDAACLLPGQSGLLALDWWNGNRSVLVDADLSGLMMGMTLATTSAEMYRALIEATAFGTRVIIEAFERGGVQIDRVVACGGLPERNRLLMQIYADVTGRSFRFPTTSQTPALGSAMFAAVAAGPAAGGYSTIAEAAAQMAHLREEAIHPIEVHRAAYDVLFGEYLRLHDLFGRGGDPAVKTLKRLRLEVIAEAARS